MRKFRPLSPPIRANPLVAQMFNEMHLQRIGVLDLSDRSGVNVNTLKDWRTRTNPNIVNFNACLNVLGLELKVCKMKDT